MQITPEFQDPADPNEAFDDPASDQTLGPEAALELARRKADALAPAVFADHPDAVVLTSDTVGITAAGRLVGTPETGEQALAMLRSLVGNAHAIATGVCLVLADERRESFVDTATVHLGQVADDALRAYVDSGQWAGKAGGYNLIERQDAGWPITVEGDPGTVMGLPMERLTPKLEQLGVPRTPPPTNVPT